MGRPKGKTKEKSIRKNYLFPESLSNDLDSAAKRLGTNPSALLKAILKVELKYL